jgi:hypothetical protein
MAACSAVAIASLQVAVILALVTNTGTATVTTARLTSERPDLETYDATITSKPESK